MIQQTLDKLYQMKLGGVADSIREQLANPTAASLSFEERLALAVDRQWDLKENRALARRLHISGEHPSLTGRNRRHLGNRKPRERLSVNLSVVERFIETGPAATKEHRQG